MNPLASLARRARTLREDASWKLLRADNAPVILAFVESAFAEQSELPFEQGRALLSELLVESRDAGHVAGRGSATGYLREWIDAGWLRELDGRLTRTDACDIALRYCEQLERRETHTTASHLRVVLDAVRDLAVDLDPDSDRRAKVVSRRIEAMQAELAALEAGVVKMLDASEQRERIREVYQLSAVLSHDFRRMEDELRALDQQLRVEIVAGNHGRGDTLRSFMASEQTVGESDAGRAFNGFFGLLRDPDRSVELREQLRAVLASDAAEHLDRAQRRYLGRLMRELNREGERVLRVRRQTDESLRAFVESGAAEEQRAVDRLLGELERTALSLRELDVPLATDTGVALDAGRARCRSPASLRVASPDERIDTGELKAQQAAHGPSDAMLDQLESVDVYAVAERMRAGLAAAGPSTLARLIEETPIASGLEELVAHVRVAQALGAARLEETEQIEIGDVNGVKLRATIPKLLLSADAFPERLGDLVL